MQNLTFDDAFITRGLLIKLYGNAQRFLAEWNVVHADPLDGVYWSGALSAVVERWRAGKLAEAQKLLEHSAHNRFQWRRTGNRFFLQQFHAVQDTIMKRRQQRVRHCAHYVWSRIAMNRNHHSIHQHIAQLPKIVVRKVLVDVLEKCGENLHKCGEKRLTWNVKLIGGFFGVIDGELCAFCADVEPNTPCSLCEENVNSNLKLKITSNLHSTTRRLHHLPSGN